jgi:hypothetical protein
MYFEMSVKKLMHIIDISTRPIDAFEYGKALKECGIEIL